MKSQSHISCWFPREEREHFYRLLESLDCLAGWHEASPHFPRSNPGLQYTFDVDDPRLPSLLEHLQSEGVDYLERREHLYSDIELKSFPLLELIVTCRSSDGGGPEHGTEYDVSAACPRCGTGAVQTSPLMMPLAGLPKKGLVCTTHRDHILVGRLLAEALQRAGLCGLELRQTRSCHNKEPLPWWQMISTCTMPRMSPHTRGIVRDTDSGWACPVCERDMYCGTMRQPAEIVYDRRQADTAALPDVVQTWECFGRSVLHDDPERHLIRGFAQPLILVKPKVLDILREQKVKRVCFSPVRIVE